MNTKENCKSNNPSEETESIADLPLTTEQGEDAGAGTVAGGGGGGKVHMQDFHFVKR